MNNEKGILGISKALFWDVDPQTIDPEKHASYIVERVITHGTWEEFKIILAYYGKSKIKLVVKKLRHLNDKDLCFCSTYFNIPLSEFRSFHFKKMNITSWDY